MGAYSQAHVSHTYASAHGTRGPCTQTHTRACTHKLKRVLRSPARMFLIKCSELYLRRVEDFLSVISREGEP